MSVIQSLWVEGELSLQEVMSIRSFLLAGHEFHLYTYDHVTQVPEGVVRCCASDVIPRDEVFRNILGTKSYSAFSNVFRYKLLYEKGGWWVDTDVVCLRRFSPLEQRFVLGEERQLENPFSVCNAILFGQEPGEELFKILFERALRIGVPQRWGETGPILLTDIVRELDLEQYVLAPEVFYPIDYWDIQRLFAPTPVAAQSYAVHLWNENLCRHRCDKNQRLPPYTLLGSLQARNLRENPMTPAFVSHKTGVTTSGTPTSSALRQNRVFADADGDTQFKSRQERPPVRAGCEPTPSARLVAGRRTARILFAWELGAGAGHWAHFQPIAERLLNNGHQIHAAVRKMEVVSTDWQNRHPIAVSQAPVRKHLTTSRIPMPRSLADMWHNVGFNDVVALRANVAQWRALYDRVQPDLIVFEHSPTALLASQGLDVRRVILGDGFSCPPDVSPLPDLRWWMQADALRMRRIELDVLRQMNAVLGDMDCPPIERITQLYAEADEKLLLSFAELDHYGERVGAKYWGIWSTGGEEAPRWRHDGRHPRVFAYLKSLPGLRDVVAAIADLGSDALVYLCEGDEIECHASSLQFIERPVDLTRIAAECDLAILNGNAAISTTFLLAGTPILQIPLHLEQAMFTDRVVQLGAATFCPMHEPQTFRPFLEAMLDDDRYRRAAGDFAARYAAFDPTVSIAGISNRIERLVG